MSDVLLCGKFCTVHIVNCVMSRSLKDRHTERVSPDEGIIKGGDEYPAGVVCHQLLPVFNAFIQSLKETSRDLISSDEIILYSQPVPNAIRAQLNHNPTKHVSTHARG